MDKLCPLQQHHFINPALSKNPLEKNHKFISIPFQTPAQLSVSTLDSSHQVSFLDDLNQFKCLNSTKLMQTQMMKMYANWDFSDEFGKKLITGYLKSGDFKSGSKLFFLGFAHNYQLLKWFLEELNNFGGNSYDVLQVFSMLHSKGVVFDGDVLINVLKLSINLMDKLLGLEIHAYLIKRGFDLDDLKSVLMNFYGRFWGIDSASQVFDEKPTRNVILWTESILMKMQNGRHIEAIQLFQNMMFSFIKASPVSIVKVLQACRQVKGIAEGKQIHGYVLRHALESNLFISNSLISMYSKNHEIELARTVFDSMENYNLSSWNSMISGYASLGSLDEASNLLQEMECSRTKPDIITWNSLLSGHFLHGSYIKVLNILCKMQELGFKPNSSSITSVLQAVSELGVLNIGKEIHCYVMRNRLDYDAYVGTSLVDMYVKNDSLIDARIVFDRMKNKNIFAWNSLISAYAYNGMFEEASGLKNQMKEEGIEPDLVTWNSLVSGYSSHGRSKEAFALMNEIKSSGFIPSVVSWTSLISGCSKNGNYTDSLKFFMEMQQEGVKPNSTTICCILQAFAGLSMLQKGKEIHCFCIRTGFFEDVYVATALIDMYSKSGNLKMAFEIFNKIQNKTLGTWNCMIMGFSIYGHGTDAISIFRKMCSAGIKPDSVTFTAVLSACKNSVLVDDGWRFFDSMSTDYNIMPTLEHFSCMVDLLGRAGYIDEAMDFIETMPLEPDATIWGALLRSCQVHKNLKLAVMAASHLYKLEPYNSANYAIMLSLYSNLNRWEDVDRIKVLMNIAKVKNQKVWSSIQIDRKVHIFSGKPHKDSGEIYFELYHLVTEMKKLFGYEPDLKCVYHNINGTEKEKVLMSHGEKLAMTYGLMKVKSYGLIRVIKNTRICSDCHTVAKYMSLLRKREILVKDGVRFHLFKEGKCSCKDCW